MDQDKSNKELDELLTLAQEINRDISENGEAMERGTNEASAEVGKAVNEVNQICSDLDRAEKEASDELGKLISEQTEDVNSGE